MDRRGLHPGRGDAAGSGGGGQEKVEGSTAVTDGKIIRHRVVIDELDDSSPRQRPRRARDARCDRIPGGGEATPVPGAIRDSPHHRD